MRVVGAYRDTEVAPDHALTVLLADLVHARQALHRTLSPLSPEEAGHLLDQLLEDMPPDGSAVRAAVLQRAGGVPFFLLSWAESVRTAAQDTGAEVPWDVAQSIRQRLAALPVGARTVVGIAAAIGREVPHGLLRAVAARDEYDLLDALDPAYQARLLESVTSHGDRFPHDVVREVVEAELGAARRAALHRQIAEALQAQPGEPPVAEIAAHYVQTPEHAQAARWLEQAGDHAAAQFAHATAVEQCTAAREKLLAAGAAEAEALSRLDEKLGDRRLIMGAAVLAQEDFARAREETGDHARQVTLRLKEGVAWWGQSQYGPAIAAYQEVVHKAEDQPVRAEAELRLSEVYNVAGNFPAAGAALQRAVEMAQTQSPTPVTTRIMGLPAWTHAVTCYFQGDYISSERSAYQMLDHYQSIGDAQGIGRAWFACSLVDLRAVRLVDAEWHARMGLDILNKSAITSMWPLRNGPLATSRWPRVMSHWLRPVFRRSPRCCT